MGGWEGSLRRRWRQTTHCCWRRSCGGGSARVPSEPQGTGIWAVPLNCGQQRWRQEVGAAGCANAGHAASVCNKGLDEQPSVCTVRIKQQRWQWGWQGLWQHTIYGFVCEQWWRLGAALGTRDRCCIDHERHACWKKRSSIQALCVFIRVLRAT
jgi:hypothetical protein